MYLHVQLSGQLKALTNTHVKGDASNAVINYSAETTETNQGKIYFSRTQHIELTWLCGNNSKLHQQEFILKLVRKWWLKHSIQEKVLNKNFALKNQCPFTLEHD